MVSTKLLFQWIGHVFFSGLRRLNRQNRIIFDDFRPFFMNDVCWTNWWRQPGGDVTLFTLFAREVTWCNRHGNCFLVIILNDNGHFYIQKGKGKQRSNAQTVSYSISRYNNFEMCRTDRMSMITSILAQRGKCIRVSLSYHWVRADSMYIAGKYFL